MCNPISDKIPTTLNPPRTQATYSTHNQLFFITKYLTNIIIIVLQVYYIICFILVLILLTIIDRLLIFSIFLAFYKAFSLFYHKKFQNKIVWKWGMFLGVWGECQSGIAQFFVQLGFKRTPTLVEKVVKMHQRGRTIILTRTFLCVWCLAYSKRETSTDLENFNLISRLLT